MKSHSPQKRVRLIEFAPALATGLLLLCLTITKGFLPQSGGAGFAMCLLTASLLSCVAAILFPDFMLPNFADVPVLRLAAREPVLALLMACLAFQCLVLFNWFFASLPIFGMIPVFIALVLWAVHAATKAAPKITLLIFAATMVFFIVCNYAVWRFLPNSLIDVAIFQRDSSIALLRGQNPYTLTFPDIYGEKSAQFYGAGASVNGVLQFGFPYLPLTLLWVFPAQILLGDFRYAYVLALVIAAVFLFLLGRKPVVAACALLLLFSIPSFFVLQHGWTEPLPVMLLCFVVWESRRKKKPLFFSVGCLVAAKQYLVLIFPLMFLLPQEKSNTQRFADGIKAVAIATFITLPFVLWNPRAFFHSALFIQIAQPFRDDSLSYLSYFKMVTGMQPPSWPGFAMAIIAIAFCLWRAPRTTTGFALSVALVMFGFVAFARQAFVNYYFLIFGALCCATALAGSEKESEAGSEKKSEAGSEIFTPSAAAAER